MLGQGEAVTIGIKPSNPSLEATTPKRIRVDNNSESSVVVSLYVYVCNHLAPSFEISIEYCHRVA